MGLLKDLTNSLKPVSNTLADTFNSGEFIDTGEITQATGLPLNGTDSAESDPTGFDLDVLSFRSAEGTKSGVAEIGLLPQSSDSWTLTDLDVLSGSYGANGLITGDIGPDIGTEPILVAHVLMDAENPFKVEILGSPVLDPLNDLGDAGGLLPFAIADGLVPGGLGGGLLSGGITDGLLSGGIIPAGLGDVLPTDALPLGILDGLLG